ncbi:MAG: nucleotide exchange factor GrpE [Ruminococcaceae bacterium]|nr:nucleotide exchange factor GrpE [Oscillospiraceae bacterium]MBQ9691650.1 nucleotide exchange factor GrpE [Clostridia bacterium]
MSDEKEIKDTEEVKEEAPVAENAPASEEAAKESECCDKDEKVSEQKCCGKDEKKTEKCEKGCKGGKKNARELEAELLKYKEAAEKAEAALKESEDKYLRILAEYDNYRKRTAKEKEGIYSDAYGDAITEILPVIDNLERAAVCTGDKVAEGVKMTLNQFKSTLEKLGVEEISANVGDDFDPTYHNAMMSVDNPDVKSGAIAMVLAKGYKKGDKVFRYAMVSVAN